MRDGHTSNLGNANVLNIQLSKCKASAEVKRVGVHERAGWRQNILGTLFVNRSSLMFY